MSLPKGFADLATAYNAGAETFLNVIGVVVDFMPPRAAGKNAQYMFTFKLLDARLRDSVYGSQGLTVRFFKADLQHLPQIRQHGDIVLLRNIKMKPYQGQALLISNYQTGVIVFPLTSIPEPGFQIAYQGKNRLEGLGIRLDTDKLSLEEQAYVIQLKQDMATTVQELPASGNATVMETPGPMTAAPTEPAAMRKRPGEPLPPTEPKRAMLSTFGNKFRLISELRHLNWADLCAQVVKKFPSKYGACELYVTDYTENKDMFYYSPPEHEDEREREGDQFGYSGPPKREWPGPFGWFVLKINVKEPHASYANREVEEGDFVLLRNVKMKHMSQLEGDMWVDDLNPEKVKISKLRAWESPEGKAVLERKDRYWDARNRKLSARAQQEDKKKLTKSEMKKQKKKRAAEKEQRLAEKAAPGTEGRKDIQTTAFSNEQNGTVNGLSKTDLNPHVRCSNEEIPIRTVKWILDPDNERHFNTSYEMPFTCAKYRARVRVVDFAPRQVEDFIVAEVLDDGEKSENSVTMQWQSSPKYEWSISLQLENAPKEKSAGDAYNRLWVSLSHEDTQYLLGNGVDDPGDLRSDPQQLVKLREKLYILWGNLEEKTDEEQISNRPFECCLVEYGIEMEDDDPCKETNLRGYEKLYKMFGVTIL